jgi:hypothetical protein
LFGELGNRSGSELAFRCKRNATTAVDCSCGRNSLGVWSNSCRAVSEVFVQELVTEGSYGMERLLCRRFSSLETFWGLVRKIWS